MMTDYTALLNPPNLWNRAAVLDKPCPVPRVPGVYAWYFRTLPPHVPNEPYHTAHGLTLLYVGISPKKPPQNGKPPSRQTLATRLRTHLNGNAKSSTLRLTLGCLLSEALGIQLRRVGSGTRMTFAQGERILNRWLDDHACVTWMPHPQPWLLEEALIQTLSLPLNLDQNSQHPFHATLTQLRAQARLHAHVLPVLQGA